MLTCTFPGWFCFLPPTHITSVQRMHRSSCRVITGCLSSTSIPLLYLEALLPPLRVTLTHQSLTLLEKALRLPSISPLASLANSNPCTRFKKGSWRSFSRPSLSCKPLIFFLLNLPSLPLLFTLSHTNSLLHALVMTLPSQRCSYFPLILPFPQRHHCLD